MSAKKKGRPKSPSTRYFIRTHRFDAPVRLLAERLAAAAGQPPILICDTRAGAFDTGDFAQAPIDEARLQELGFRDLPKDWGWFCGDLFYHVAALADPEAEYLCLMDGDIFLSEAAASALVSFFDGEMAEAAAVDLRLHEAPPKYSKGLSALDLDPRLGCLFPLTRIHRSLLAPLRDLRLRSSQSGQRLNDEAVLAAAAASTGSATCDLREGIALFPAESFATNPPHLFEALSAGNAPAAVVHPVVTLEGVLSRIGSGEKAYGRHRLRRVLRQATGPQRKAIVAALDQVEAAGAAAIGTGSPRLDHLLRLLGADAALQILDVGANPIEGDVSYKQLLDARVAQVTGFEPQEAALAELNARKSANETYHPNALGDGSERELHLFRQSGFTSIFPGDPDSAALLGFQKGMVEVGRLTIRTDRLDDIGAVPRPDMLKIDVQGSEVDIIANGRSKLSVVLLVQTEVRLFPIYRGEPALGDLARELTRLGLQFHSYAFIKRVALQSRFRARLARRTFSQAVDGDAFFVRDLRKVASFSDSDLAKLAVLADSVMDAVDLVLFCLDHLVARGRLSPADAETYFDLLPREYKKRR